jgi:cytochrome d ubiquinol oxidase subunit II
MSHDVLAIIWFAILLTAWSVYLALESFVVGSGMLQPFITRDKAAQQAISRPAGLHWDGIEVWLITAIGGTFAAFPAVFAKTLESLYVAFFLLLILLMIRGVTIELAYKDENPKWQKIMIRAWNISSLLIPLVFGVYFSNIFGGLKLGLTGNQGKFYEIFNLNAIIMGVLFVAVCAITGSAWIVLTGGENRETFKEKAFPVAFKASIVVALAVIYEMMAFNTGEGIFGRSQLFNDAPVLWAVPVLLVLVALANILFTRKKKVWLSLVFGMLTLPLIVVIGYLANYPYMLPSSLNAKFGVDLFEAASSQYTLTVMFYAAVIFVPIVLVYQGWKFWYFAKR